MNEPENLEAAFMGKITAGATHELKNVLAIIKESAGLMEDLIALNKDQFPLREKFLNVLTRIGDQVARGVEISSRLNHFAHTPDTAVASVDLNDVVEHVAFLAHRFARSRKIALKPVLQERSIVLTTDPLKLQMIIFDCLDLIINMVSMGSGITLLPREVSEGQAAIDFSTDRGREYEQIDPSAWPSWGSLQLKAGQLKARVEPGSAPVWLSLFLTTEGK
jgi:phosphoglycerate-specific signal transduction histidine kinase